MSNPVKKVDNEKSPFLVCVEATLITLDYAVYSITYQIFLFSANIKDTACSATEFGEYAGTLATKTLKTIDT